MLREEVRKAKFDNERDGYDKFKAGLTILRKRSPSKDGAHKNMSTLDKSLTRTSIDRASAEMRFSPLRDKISAKMQESANNRKRMQETAQLEDSIISIKKQQEMMKVESRRVESPLPVLMTQMLDETIAQRREKVREVKEANKAYST